MNMKNNEHSRMRSQLKAIQQTLDSFIRQSLDPVVILDANDRVVSLNDRFETTFGWRAEDLLGITSSEMPMVPAERSQEVEQNLIMAIAGLSVEGYESERITRYGERIKVIVSCFPLRDEYGKISGRAVILRDITWKKKTEELLIQTEKLAIVSELAAGIAHEIRNPITTLKGFLQLLQAGKTERKEYYYEVMTSEIEQIEQILSELLVLAKPQALRFRQFNLIGIVENAIEMISDQARLSGIEIVTRFSRENIVMRCEESQLKQMFTNLMKNAIEAMQAGGKLKIEVEMCCVGHVRIRVEDEGHGIPPHIMKRIGQPFYTTKEKGTGIGFMVSKKIIENHNGILSITSEENVGTVVEIKLPIA